MMTTSSLGRHRTRDDGRQLYGMGHNRGAAMVRDSMGRPVMPGMTFDTLPGGPLPRTMRTHDGRTVDSTGSFLIGELERLDPTINGPLFTVTWQRDIELREDVSIGDELASWTNSSFASPGGLTSNGKSFISKLSDTIQGVSLDIGKTAQPLPLWGQEVSYTIPELESAIRLGRPVDSQKLEGLQIKHNMDADEMVYIGDPAIITPLGTQAWGLTNDPNVSVAPAAATGTSSSTLWTSKTPTQILTDVNTTLYNAWLASGYKQTPTKMLLPPFQYSYLVSTLISSAGNQSILAFLEANSICLQNNGKKLDIKPVKWLTGRGVPVSSVATDRMMVYTPDKRYTNWPKTPLMKTPLEFRSIYHITTYYCRFGVVEKRYLETFAYCDGI